MPLAGDYFSQSDIGEKDKVSPPTVNNKAFWDNPGFWAKVGEIGSALVGSKTPLGVAGKYAADYHNAQQFGETQRKILANAAAGVDPMTGITSSDTMGLSAEQIDKMTKTGLTRQSDLAKEERENKLAENTLLSGDISRKYTKALTDKVMEDLRQDEMFEQHIKDVSEGKVASKYITPENAEFFKAIGPKRSNEIISEIVKQEEIAKRQGRKTQQVQLGDRIKLVDSETGMPIQEWKIGPKPADAGTVKKNTADLITAANRQAFVDLYPEIEKEFYASFKGNRAELARKMQELKLMFENPSTTEAAMLKMRSMAPKTLDAFTARSNEVLSSYEEGKGTPPLRKLTIPTEDSKSNKQSKAQMEKIISHPKFQSSMSEKLKGKSAGDYDVVVNGQKLRVRVDGNGGWDLKSK